MIVDAHFPEQAAIVRELFNEYADSIGVDIAYQGFCAELEALPGAYGPPDGALLLAVEEDEYVGCVALRRLEDNVCEMKRLYVAPAGRGKGLGLKLAEAIIVRACELGYEKMRLDTMDKLKAANRLYEKIGFIDIPSYRYNPDTTARFMELDLSRS